jgi:hypothetical protein
MIHSHKLDDLLCNSALSWKNKFQFVMPSEGCEAVPITSERYDQLLTIYPKMKAGLELCCGVGRRIRGGRAAKKNIFGIDENPLHLMWQMLKVDDFCQVGTVHDIPYDDNTFDFICYPPVLKHDRAALREMKRVCNGNFYLKVDGSIGIEKWVDTLAQEGFYLEVFMNTEDGNFVVEGRFLIGGTK